MEFNSFFEPVPRVVAHRGDNENYPENTLPSFLSAQKLGIDIIETDVHLSKDNVVVIWHDNKLDRNTNGKGRVEDYNLSELKKLDAGFSFTKDKGKTFPFRGKGITLCTLEEALLACPKERFNVDLKTKAPQMVKEFIKVIEKTNSQDRVVCASFHLSNLKLTRELAPYIATSVTTLEVLPLLFKQKLHLLSKRPFDKLVIFQLPYKIAKLPVVTKNFIKIMHKKGAIVMVWTINDAKSMKKLFSKGIDSIMSDKPSLLVEVAKELKIK